MWRGLMPARARSQQVSLPTDSVTRGTTREGRCSVRVNNMFSPLLRRHKAVPCRTPAKESEERGDAAVSPAATITDAALCQGDATAARKPAKGGAGGARAEGSSQEPRSAG